MSTNTAAAAIAGRLGHAGNSFTAAFGKEDRKLALGMLPATYCAMDGRVGLTHRADRLEYFFAVLADIFINWHKHLYKVVTTLIVSTFYSFFICG